MVGQSAGRRALTATAFLAPSLTPLLLFTLGPMAASLVISLLRWELLRPPQWKGLGNYAVRVADPDFHAAVGHTVFFILGYRPLVFLGCLAIALGVKRKHGVNTILPT